MILPFEEWRPDLAPLSPGAESAVNVLPSGDGYVPMPTPAFLGPMGLPELPSLLLAAEAPDGVTVPLAFTERNVWRSTGTAWVKTGRPGGSYTDPSLWSAVQRGDEIFAVNGIDPVQVYTIGADHFDDVPGLGNGLGAHYLALVGQFLVLYGTYRGAGSESHPYRAQWSGIARPRSLEPDAAIQADFSDQPEIGRARGITGGEFGLLLGESGLARMDYVGPPEIWQFRTLETDVGCEAPRTVVKAGDRTFFYSRKGWRMSDGGPSVPIGLDKVDKLTAREIDLERAHRISAMALLREPCILWAIPSRTSPDREPDLVLCYNYERQRWSRGIFRCSVLGRSSAPSRFTDDDPPFAEFTDDVALLTDSGGGEGQFQGAIVDGTLHVLQVQEGVTAEITTTEVNLIEGRRAHVSRIRPVVHGAPRGLQVAIECREDQADETVRVKGPHTLEPGGSAAVHAKARYHRFRTTIGHPFKVAMGVEVLRVAEAGRR